MFLAETDLRALLTWLAFIMLPLLGRLVGWLSKKASSARPEVEPVEPKTKPERPSGMWDFNELPAVGAAKDEAPAQLQPEPIKPLPVVPKATPVRDPRAIDRLPLRMPMAPVEVPEAKRRERAAERSSVSGHADPVILTRPMPDGPRGAVGQLADRHFEGSLKHTDSEADHAYDHKHHIARKLPKDRASLRRAILWTEILGPPVALRDEQRRSL